MIVTTWKMLESDANYVCPNKVLERLCVISAWPLQQSAFKATSGSLEALMMPKAVWSFATKLSGALSVTTSGESPTLKWCVDSWDSLQV